MMDGLRTIRLDKVKIKDSFFGSYAKLVAEKMIPYQWDILNDHAKDAMPSGCIRNFRIAAGELSGERQGTVFLDTDLYKWIEAVAFCIENGSGSKYVEIVDEVIGLIGRAQQEDGYLNTYFTVISPNKRWNNLVEGHELYTAGHMIEAAVAYYSATGKKNFLIIAEKYADLICKVFGTGEGQINGYPGHQEIELALVKLYKATKEKRYLDQAKYFIDERGKKPSYFQKEIEKHGGYEYFHEFTDYDLKYSQAHMPPVEQRFAEGHAVRAVYMYSAMADLSKELDDAELSTACQALWDNVTKKRMYITGSIGSSGFLERFTTDYDLPNNTNYSETCASVGLMMFGHRMNMLTGDAAYYDIVERLLYNSILGGMNITGDRYFYVNPLEVVPDFCTEHTYMSHVKADRQKWFSCACCPPNVARTLAALGHYIYAQDNEAIYINQFISSTAEFELGDVQVSSELISTLMQDGKIRMLVETAERAKFTVKIRIPEYSGQIKAKQDGLEVAVKADKGYACFRVDGVTSMIEIDFDVKPRFISANQNVRADVGKVALMKGPCVYCLEEKDNGSNLAAVYVSANSRLQEDKPLDLVGDWPTYNYQGIRLTNEGVKEDELYGIPLFTETSVDIKAVPYCLWNNRGGGEMLVWQKVRL